MSDTPNGPEYYTPPQQASPPPPPPSISDAAQQWQVAQAGEVAETPYQAGYPAQPAQVPPPYAYAPPPGAPRPAQGLAITALVIGIIAFVTGWIPVWGIVLGVVAIVIGSIALAKKQSKGMAVTGIITGALGAIASAAFLAVAAFSINWASNPDNWFTYSADPGDYYMGDGATLAPESVDGSLAVVEQAFGPTSWDENTWWYVAIVDNPSDQGYVSADVTVVALDESGAEIDSSWTYTSLPSGQTAVAGFFYEVGSGEVASLAVVGPTTEALSSEATGDPAEFGPLTETSDEWSTTVTGTVTSTSDEELYAPAIVVVARDASGTIVGSATAYIETLPAGATEEFEAYFLEPMPEGTTYEAYLSTF